MNRYHWDTPQHTTADGTDNRHRRWMRDVLSVVIGSAVLPVLDHPGGRAGAAQVGGQAAQSQHRAQALQPLPGGLDHRRGADPLPAVPQVPLEGVRAGRHHPRAGPPAPPQSLQDAALRPTQRRAQADLRFCLLDPCRAPWRGRGQHRPAGAQGQWRGGSP